MELTFSKSDIIAKVIENRAAHYETWEQAHQGFMEQLIEKTTAVSLAAVAYNAGTGKYSAYSDAMSTLQMIDKPSHYLSEYDRAISMLEATIDDEITLNEQDYNRYMLDQWQWARAFQASSSTYLAR